MYPMKVYISKPGYDRYTMYSVIIRGYTQGISVDAFNTRILKAGSKAYHGFAGINAYQSLPNYEREFEIENQQETEQYTWDKHPNAIREPLYTIVDSEYELADFYKEICYDPKSGKIDGRTLLQHIKHYWGLSQCGK